LSYAANKQTDKQTYNHQSKRYSICGGVIIIVSVVISTNLQHSATSRPQECSKTVGPISQTWSDSIRLLLLRVFSAFCLMAFFRAIS